MGGIYQTTKGHTKNLTGSMTIDFMRNVSQVTLSAIAGACDVKWDMPFGDEPSDTITIPEGSTLTLSGKNSAPIDGLTLTAAGTTAVILVF